MEKLNSNLRLGSETPLQTEEVVAKFPNRKLHLDFSTVDIHMSYRIGSFQADGNCPIICKIVSRFTQVSITMI